MDDPMPYMLQHFLGNSYLDCMLIYLVDGEKKIKKYHRIYSTMTTLLTRADGHVDLFGSFDIGWF